MNVKFYIVKTMPLKSSLYIRIYFMKTHAFKTHAVCLQNHGVPSFGSISLVGSTVSEGL